MCKNTCLFIIGISLINLSVLFIYTLYKVVDVLYCCLIEVNYSYTVKVKNISLDLYSISSEWFEEDGDKAEFFAESSLISISDFPYVVSVVRQEYWGRNYFLCAGTIYRQLFDHGIVLTTAGCLNRLIMVNKNLHNF